MRAAAQWSRALRDRVAGEESAAGALGGQLIAVAGSKGGVGTTTVALQLTLAAVRAAPGRPVCLVDFDLQKGDLRGYLNLPYRRSVVDLVEVANEISVRHLQETLYTHKEGFRVLLAPDDGERGEEVDSAAARAVLAAVKARHALTIVDLGAQVSEASAIGAEMAGRVVVVTTPDVVSLRGVKRLRDLWRRLQVREDEDVHVVLNRTSRKLEIQPDLARKVVGAPLAQTTIPDEFAAFEAAVNTGVPSRVEDAKLRAAFERLAAELEVLPGRRGGRGDGRRAARPALPPRRRARPVLRRGHGPAAGARRDPARDVADRAGRLHVHARRPRGPRGRARAGHRPDRRPRSSTRTSGSPARTCRRRGARARRSRCRARRTRCASGCASSSTCPW